MGDKPRPTHDVFLVSGDPPNTKWNPIGAAWPHKDGKGFYVKLGGELVIRDRSAQSEASNDAGDATADAKAA